MTIPLPDLIILAIGVIIGGGVALSFTYQSVKDAKKAEKAAALFKADAEDAESVTETYRQRFNDSLAREKSTIASLDEQIDATEAVKDDLEASESARKMLSELSKDLEKKLAGVKQSVASKDRAISELEVELSTYRNRWSLTSPNWQQTIDKKVASHADHMPDPVAPAKPAKKRKAKK